MVAAFWLSLAGLNLLASVRLALIGWIPSAQNGSVKFLTRNGQYSFELLKLVTWKGWCLLSLVLIPMYVGEFARSEASPIPWIEFADEHARHGLANGLLSSFSVCAVDLWLLWIPVNIWVSRHPQLNKTTKTMARVINALVGLLLMTPNNPIYRLPGWLRPEV